MISVDAQKFKIQEMGTKMLVRLVEERIQDDEKYFRGALSYINLIEHIELIEHLI